MPGGGQQSGCTGITTTLATDFRLLGIDYTSVSADSLRLEIRDASVPGRP